MASKTEEHAKEEERIFVSVRVRPLNDKEKAKNESSDWQCVGNTLMYNQPDRLSSPPAYSFDRVFGNKSSTKQVYQEGAKDVALSVVNGINSTIFAYGQTSSGKTYTMNGVTQYAVSDIYHRIESQSDREFVMKFSAMEIYNEVVRDLLSSENAQLRLRDDPEKGTVVDKLTEEVLRDREHLAELLSTCAAQRKIGETSLNETSSRSHQILRLTVESTAKKFNGLRSSGTLAATVNFVDLAGSERVSQTLSTSAVLKEGCHINKSLLTLGTVIRKLSKGRNGHIPYRDSKLTRILQNSLGGNARTSIICTMSPARSHAEQSKNTLFFASCAKEVTTNAKVNVVRSDKVLVKQLQQQLAKMEYALKSLETDSMKEKELLLQQMDQEIKELTKQRDLAQSRVQNLLESLEEGRSVIDENSELEPSDMNEKARIPPDNTDIPSCASNYSKHFRGLSEISDENFLMDGIDLNLEGWPDVLEGTQAEAKFSSHVKPGENAHNKDTEHEHLRVPEDVYKEIRCIDQMEESSMNKNKAPTDDDAGSLSLQKEDAELRNASEEYEALQRKIQDLKKTIHNLVTLNGSLDQSHFSSESSPASLSLSRSRSARAVLLSSPSLSSPTKESIQNETVTCTRFKINVEMSPKEDVKEPVMKTQEVFKHKVPKTKHGKLTRRDSGLESFLSLQVEPQMPHEDNVVANELPSRSAKGSLRWKLFKSKQPSTKSVMSSNASSVMSAPVAWKVIQNFSEADLEDSRSVINFDDEHKIDKYDKHGRPLKRPGCKDGSSIKGALGNNAEFERRRGMIIELWDAGHVPLVHRSHFFLVYKGDPSDFLYVEVELRRLIALHDAFNKSSATTDRHAPTPASSLKALKKEREMLSKKVHKRFSRTDRERLYQKWGIRLNTKERSLQLTNYLWTSTMDMGHIRESAALVAKLIGLTDQPLQAPKEILGISFLSQPVPKKASFWRDTMSTL